MNMLNCSANDILCKGWLLLDSSYPGSKEPVFWNDRRRTVFHCEVDLKRESNRESSELEITSLIEIRLSIHKNVEMFGSVS